MRRKRAKDVLCEILRGFVGMDLAMPTPDQMLDYLTNTVQCLELMLKLLSGDWSSHRVGEMFKKITGEAHHNPALMQALGAAAIDQKYLLSPSEGIIDHIPELDYMGDFLYQRLRQRYPKFMVETDEDLPDNFARFLLDNVELIYRKQFPRTSLSTNLNPVMEDAEVQWRRDLDRIRKNLATFLSNGGKLTLNHISIQALLPNGW